MHYTCFSYSVRFTHFVYPPLIVENDETALYNGLKMIMDDHHILSEYKQNMRKEMHMNDSVTDVENLIDL